MVYMWKISTYNIRPEIYVFVTVYIHIFGMTKIFHFTAYNFPDQGQFLVEPVGSGLASLIPLLDS